MIQSACGVGSAQAGPFYCPGDYKVYIDLSFLNQLRQMGAPGDFAFAYVIAHEVGHHVQNLVGIARQVQTQKQQVSKVQANALSVRMELQADCLAGIWINHTEKRKSILEAGDIEEGLNAAAAVGDDRIMKSAGRAVHREAFTHGSSAERVNWFKRGMQTGDLNACNTFG
jgi:predicted metalloprotease